MSQSIQLFQVASLVMFAYFCIEIEGFVLGNQVHIYLVHLPVFTMLNCLMLKIPLLLFFLCVV